MGRILLWICAVVVAMGLAAASAGNAIPPELNQTRSADHRARHPQATATKPINDVQSVGGQESSREANDIARRDLTAQQAMALLALLQLGLTAGGLWLIYETLRETRKAVKEAADGTEAAQRAVTETSRIGEAQVRAYLSVIGLNYTAKAEKTHMVPAPAIELVLNNSGATPAINIAHYCGCAVSTVRAAQAFECPDTIPFVLRLPTVPANATETRDGWSHNIINCIDEYAAADLLVTENSMFGDMPQLVLWGTVLYDDVFGKSYRSDYAFVVFHRDELVSHSLSVADAPQRCFQPIADRVAVVKRDDS